MISRKRGAADAGLVEEQTPGKRQQVLIIDLTSDTTPTREQTSLLANLLESNYEAGSALPPCQAALIRDFLDSHRKPSSPSGSATPIRSSSSTSRSPSSRRKPTEASLHIQAVMTTAVVLIPPKKQQAESVTLGVVPENRDNSATFDCAICHDPVNFTIPGSCCVLPCRHAYHQGCIKTWFINRRNLNSPIACPRCRKAIPYENGHENTFLADNDLLPAPARELSEQEILDNFITRLQQVDRWDRTTKVAVGLAMGLMMCGLWFGGVVGSVLGIFVGFSVNYRLPRRLMMRFLGWGIADIAMTMNGMHKRVQRPDLAVEGQELTAAQQQQADELKRLLAIRKKRSLCWALFAALGYYFALEWNSIMDVLVEGRIDDFDSWLARYQPLAMTFLILQVLWIKHHPMNRLRSAMFLLLSVLVGYVNQVHFEPKHVLQDFLSGGCAWILFSLPCL